MRFVRALGIFFAALAVLCMWIGCGSGNNVLASQFQPQVNNAADNFQFQATGVTNVTQTLTYTWPNSGIAATVNQATTVTKGQAILNIRDASGVQVYSADLLNNGTFDTATGQTGNWTIVLTLTNYSGTLNFRVQKK